MKDFNPLTDPLDLLGDEHLLELLKYNVSISSYKGVKPMYIEQEHKNVAHAVSRGNEIHKALQSRGVPPKFKLAGIVWFVKGSSPKTSTLFLVKDEVYSESVAPPSFCSAPVESDKTTDDAPL